MRLTVCKKCIISGWTESELGRTLSELLRKYFEADSTDRDEAFYKRTQIPCSTFISAHKVPSPKQKIVSSSVIVDRPDQILLHCVVAVDLYYGCDAERFNTIMVEADEEQY